MTTQAHPQQGSKFDPNELKPGAILTNADNIRCRVDRVEHETVYLTVMDGQEIDGKTEFAVPLTGLVNSRWRLMKKAA